MHKRCDDGKMNTGDSHRLWSSQYRTERRTLNALITLVRQLFAIAP